MHKQHDTDRRWGQDIVPGASVTTYGRHGVGQPPIDGVVRRVDADGSVVIRTIGGKTRRRTISNVRRVD